MRTVSLALLLAACAPSPDDGRPGDASSGATPAGLKLRPPASPADPPRLRWADPGSFFLAKPTDPVGTARAYLRARADALGTTSDVLDSLDVDDTLRLPGGGTLVRLSLRHDALPVLGSRLAVLLDPAAKPVAWSLGPAWTSPLGGPATPAPSHGPDVLGRAVARAHGRPADALAVTLGPVGPDGWRALRLTDRDGVLRLRTGRARPCWHARDGALEGAWELETDLFVRTRHEAARRVVSDLDASELAWRDLVAHAPTWRVWADPEGVHAPLDGPHGDASPHPTGTPDGTEPTLEWPVDLAFAGLPTHPGGTVEPWLPDDATELTGNHAEAYADRASPDGFGTGDVRPFTVVPGRFAWDYDFLAAPTADEAQAGASATQAYYVVNWLHDWYYASGFDEAHGNAQSDNLGRGGLDGDRMRLEVQDGIDAGSRNNANMTTPADGSSPRMQIFVWSGWSESTLTVDGIADPIAVRTATFGPQDFAVEAPLRALPPDEALACVPVATDLTGRVALVNRGSCTFVQKATHVQAAGAVAMIIANNVSGSAIGMTGTAPDVTIPSLGVSMSDGATLAALLASAPEPTAHLYRREDPDIDGALDSSVVAHEWGHYLLHRLATCSTTACRGMSEGWSDFVALHLALRDGDDPRGAYAVGAWSMHGRDPDALYYGVRRTAYSADPTVQPLRFRHLSDGATLPPPPFLAGSSANSQVHNAGEVWAGMLFDAYASLIAAHPELPFPDLQRRMSDLVVASMALSPAEPTHLEARDALLAAAYAVDPGDATTLASAFAARGMGTCALGPARESSDLRGIVEDDTVRARLHLDTPVLLDGPDSCDEDGVLDRGETATLRVRVHNASPFPSHEAWVELASDMAGVVPWPARVDVGPLAPFEDITRDVEVSAARGIPAGTAATWTATLHAPDTCTATEVRALGATLEHDIAPQGAREDGFELDVGAWTLDGAGASTYWRRGSVTPHDARWVGASAPRTADVRLRSPELQASYGSALRLRFRHRHRFESDTTAHWDGGVLEVQVDGGPWEALPADVDPTTGRIEWDATLNAVRTTATNPLAGRRAWVGTSAGWPNLEEVSLDFGTRWAGRAVRFRWRLGSDQSVAREGWELDDVAVEGVSGTPFPARVADATACNDRPPVADAGPDLDARSGDTVLLDGTATADPDGDPLAFTWSQVDGPVVTLDATGATATFVAPSVLAPTVLRLALRASDGELDSHDTVDVTVRPINRAPVADAGPDVTVTEGDVVTLDGSASDDPDGDAILFAWTLPADAPVVLDDPASPATSFVAPQVERDTELQVDLSVSDGFLQATDSVVVRILPRNQPPWADAGIDRTVRSGDPVALDASASNDPDGDALSLLWALEGVEGLAPEIPSAAQTSFRAPNVAVPTDLRVTLTVSDGALTATDTALVHVLPPNLPPVARAGGDRSVPSGGTVVLDASACEDPDGDTLNVGWSIAGDPARIEDAAAAVTLLHAPTVTEDTVYVVTLDVSDGLATATDTFRLTVTAPPPSDTGTDPTPGDTGPLRDTGTDPTPGDTGPLPDTATDDTATDDTATDDTATDDTAGKPAAEVPGYHADDRVTDVGCRTCGTTRGAVSVTPPGAGDAESGDSDTDRQADGDDAPTASTGESMSPADPEGACGCLYPPSDARPAATVMLGLATFVRRRRRA